MVALSDEVAIYFGETKFLKVDFIGATKLITMGTKEHLCRHSNQPQLVLLFLFSVIIIIILGFIIYHHHYLRFHLICCR